MLTKFPLAQVHSRNANFSTTIICMRRIDLDKGNASGLRAVSTKLYTLGVMTGGDSYANVNAKFKHLFDQLEDVSKNGVTHPEGGAVTVHLYAGGDAKW